MKRYLAPAVAVCVWVYVGLVLAAWVLLRCGGDRWWLPTVMLFAPRWIYALPLLLLGPLAAVTRSRLLWALLAAGAIVFGPMMDLYIGWRRPAPSGKTTLRVLTCNAQQNRLDAPALIDAVESLEVDVVALQECQTNNLPEWPAGWHVHREGQLVIASSHEIREVGFQRRRHPPSRWPPVELLHCLVETPRGAVRFCNVHLRSPRRGLEQVLDRWTLVSPSRSPVLVRATESRRRDSEDVSETIAGFAEPVIIAGDFNMPVDSAIYRRYWGSYVNAFSASGRGYGYTKRSMVKGWQYGLRIDHILAGLGWRPRRCRVGPDVGSDHLPLIADF